MRRFRLVRDIDETGISGTGHISDGVMWEDGACAMRWRTSVKSTAVYASIEDLVKIHGHGGKTRVEWIDAFHFLTVGAQPATTTAEAEAQNVVMRKRLQELGVI